MHEIIGASKKLRECELNGKTVHDLRNCATDIMSGAAEPGGGIGGKYPLFCTRDKWALFLD